MKPPEFLGPYRIGKTLGKGGMGTVYKAVHETTGETVAVKLIATQVSDEMRFRRRFHGEVETLKRLKHPNIVRLIGYGEEHGTLFYSMEYVDGETVQTVIHREKRVQWVKALDIAIQVCAALKHAHDFGVIHRDLKPANLILQGDGQVKLVDFGISKIFGFDQTAAGSLMGTADYMAPEQANEGGITARTDLYSLGSVMYAMLAGKPPFRGKDITEVIAALTNKDPVPLELIDPDLPEDIVLLVEQLLSKRPEDRPPTALAVMNRLKAMRAGLLRMQTLSEDASPSEEMKTPLSDNSKSDTRPSEVISFASGKTGVSIPDDRVTDDTLDGVDEDNIKTESSQVDPKAGTVHTEGRGRKHQTELATGVTHRPDVSPSSDTSAGSEQHQTHFQTVSDGDLRSGYFASDAGDGQESSTRTLSIAVLAMSLMAGAALLVALLRDPPAEALLAEIDDYYAVGDDFEAQKSTDRFVKLYPDHPNVSELIDRVTAHKVENAIRRLRLKAKLRTSDGPLYEQTFLDAMDLRSTDPRAASEKLIQWRQVFYDSQMDPEDERFELAYLALFEAERLTGLPVGEEGRSDSRLSDLMKRIDRANKLEEPERSAKLKAIVTFSEGQDWAAEAKERAEKLLKGA